MGFWWDMDYFSDFYWEIWWLNGRFSSFLMGKWRVWRIHTMWVPTTVLRNGSMGQTYFIVRFERGGRNVRKHPPAILMCKPGYQGNIPPSTHPTVLRWPHLPLPYLLLVSIYGWLFLFNRLEKGMVSKELDTWQAPSCQCFVVLCCGKAMVGTSPILGHEDLCRHVWMDGDGERICRRQRSVLGRFASILRHFNIDHR